MGHAGASCGLSSTSIPNYLTCRAPYVFYGLKYIDLVSLDGARPANLKCFCCAFFFQMAHNLDLSCVLISDPSTVRAGANARLESRIKKCTPHCVCRLSIPSHVALARANHRRSGRCPAVHLLAALGRTPRATDPATASTNAINLSAMSSSGQWA